MGSRSRVLTTKRAGWIKRDVDAPESIADHMYRMGLMALIMNDLPSVNRDKCIKMAIVHDIAEAIVGDITPSDGVPKEEKSRREREALQHMCKLLGEEGQRAKEITDLWMEYEDNSSPEAKIVKDFDKIEMILQALEYETGEFPLSSTLEIMLSYVAFLKKLQTTKVPKFEFRDGGRSVTGHFQFIFICIAVKLEQGKDLDEFFQSTAGKFQTELGKSWAAEIVSRRRKQN
ncbi:hypothetical protein ACFE04_025034 [Oxalis oulophora]